MFDVSFETISKYLLTVTILIPKNHSAYVKLQKYLTGMIHKNK